MLITLSSHEVYTSHKNVISSHGTILVYYLDTKNLNKVTVLGGKISV